MAIGSYIRPIKVHEGDEAAARVNYYQAGATGTFYPGDIVLISSSGGTVTVPTAIAGTDAYTILGIVAEKKVVATATAADAQVAVIEARPGITFTAAAVGAGGTTDVATTAVATDLLGKTFGIVQVTNLATLGGTQVVHALGTAITAATDGACVRTLGWAPMQTAAVTKGLFEVPACLNPRLRFAFSKTFWTINTGGTTAL